LNESSSNRNNSPTGKKIQNSERIKSSGINSNPRTITVGSQRNGFGVGLTELELEIALSDSNLALTWLGLAGSAFFVLQIETIRLRTSPSEPQGGSRGVHLCITETDGGIIFKLKQQLKDGRNGTTWSAEGAQPKRVGSFSKLKRQHISHSHHITHKTANQSKTDLHLTIQPSLGRLGCEFVYPPTIFEFNLFKFK